MSAPDRDELAALARIGAEGEALIGALDRLAANYAAHGWSGKWPWK